MQLFEDGQEPNIQEVIAVANKKKTVMGYSCPVCGVPVGNPRYGCTFCGYGVDKNIDTIIPISKDYEEKERK
jgi:hypothetical protein